MSAVTAGIGVGSGNGLGSGVGGGGFVFSGLSMASTDATAYPIKAQAFRAYFVVKSSSTGNPITGGLTGLSTAGNRQASIDGAAFSNLTNSPVEIGTTGYAYVDFTAAEMTGSNILVRVAATNTNALETCFIIYPLDMSEVVGRPDAQTVKRPEYWLTAMYARWHNKFTQSRSTTGAATLYKADSSTTMVAGTVDQSADPLISVNKMS